jgi:hypothetical protein
VSLDARPAVARQQGDPARALELYVEALTIQERTFGPEHTEVARTFHNMVNRRSGSGVTSRSCT